MDDEIKKNDGTEEVPGYENAEEVDEGGELGHSDYTPTNRFDASMVHHLSGMYIGNRTYPPNQSAHEAYRASPIQR